MKLILLFLILTFNVHAMERLTVSPNNGATMTSEFETKELALESLRYRTTKKKWMKCDWLVEEHELGLPKTFEAGVDGMGEPISMEKHCHPKNFTYSIDNIDDEIAEKETVVAARVDEVSQVKLIINSLNNDANLKPYLKKLLKHLIREHHGK